MIGNCNLCNNKDELQESHIIPSFVFKWKKKHETGFLRSSRTPNKRIQDGEKFPLLCSTCEQRFGVWEDIFSRNIFKPFHNNSSIKVFYEDWALKFAVSVSWRVLIYHKIKNGLKHFSDPQKILADNALKIWKEFLLEKRPNIGEFEQHLFPVDIISNAIMNKEVSPYINRYFVGTVEFDVIRTHQSALVFSKLNKWIIIGIIQKPCKDYFEGTKIELEKGKLSPRIIVLPEQLFHYFNNRANKSAEYLSSLTNHQRKIIEDSYIKNINELQDSDIINATTRDYLISGKNAFNVLNRNEDFGKKGNNDKKI